MSLSFLRGLVAAMNPCGFILLPTYLMYFLGMQGQMPGSQRSTVRRALLVSASLSAGFMTVFVTVGIVSYNFTSWIQRNSKYATIVIGIALVALGISMLFGYKLPINTPRIDKGGRSQGIGSMFVYGVAYAVASLGCTIGLFLPSILTVRNDGFVGAVGNVAAYGTGMALLVTALTVSLAVANQGFVRLLRSGMQYVDRIAAVFVLLSGIYLVYYFWVVDIQEQADPITTRVESIQNSVLTALSDNWQIAAVVLGLIVAAAVGYVVLKAEDDGDVESATFEAAGSEPLTFHGD